MAAREPKHRSLPQPLIPEKYIDIPAQRLYYLSIGLLCQAIKLFDLIWSVTSSDGRFANFRKWLLVDFVYCTALTQLKIPRLTYGRTTVLLQIALLWFLDGLMFGGITIHGSAIFGGPSESVLPGFSKKVDFPPTTESFSLLNLLSPLSFGLLPIISTSNDEHLLGQHTVRMSPISTARLNPHGSTFCLASPNDIIFIPVLLNNTNISGLKYSLTRLDNLASNKNPRVDYVDLSSKELKALEQSYGEKLQPVRPMASDQNTGDYDEYDDEDDAAESHKIQAELQSTQSLVYIRINKPGIVRLEHVFDTSSTEARLAPVEVTVVPCPEMRFVDNDESATQNIRCAEQNSNLTLMIDIFGVPPLSLRWLKSTDGDREQLLVEGIEGDHDHIHSADGGDHLNGPVPQVIKLPLMISLDKPGSYFYALEEIIDGLGNIIRTSNDVTPTTINAIGNTKTTRSFTVLQKPTVSFEHCNSLNPASLLIGSEVPLSIRTSGANNFDAPWDIYLKYAEHNKGSGSKKAWKKTLKTEGNTNVLSLSANSPGDYTILGIKGKYCTGEVHAPDTCKVIEKPLPLSEIEWKRIHECSGDTGVSASLVLHGTPPFQVTYRIQRDNESPLELTKVFSHSRSELTIQPERSGHYTFSFLHMSDSNYKKVELHGPSIDQLIHPLASADFSSTTGTGGRNKRVLSSCAGDSVDVDVDLKGTGPWNLEMQVIGPMESETLTIKGIETAKKTLQIPIPEAIKGNGGSFEIDIVSVEDVYKCKRSVSVPGMVVNVKRVKPTVQFYGNQQERQATVTEHERASLPLRLTGDGPWKMSYRRDDSKVMTTVLNNPNDFLHVTQNGLYEIIDISDRECPGSVNSEASTFRVSWIPRPSAQLSPQTKAVYETYNRSYILQSICEGSNDHVDLDLTGRPPFQIMYNIAQNSEVGGTKLMDQPVFNSIQPRTRFQLHTSMPGRMYYEVKQIGDASYPLSKHKGRIIPPSERLLFEQQVEMRPSAWFKSRNRLSHCLNDPFTPSDTNTLDGVIILEGSPPFILKLSIKNLASSHVDMETVEVTDTVWRINIPSYTFTSIGPHLVKIESVVDSSSCDQLTLDPLQSSVWVDVAETAAIIPIERREDICIGELTQFQLEGIPPWTIGYRINNKAYSQVAKVSPFSILQQQQGEFTITSIAHQQMMCKAIITDLKFSVHPLPSAKVGHGKRIYQDIHEGDQAEIVFTLTGEPPFTFTYQRSEPVTKKGGKPGKILETHTVSRIFTNEYSIFSALEGTWTVTSISDRYCRYPPVQPEIVSKEKQ